MQAPERPNAPPAAVHAPLLQGRQWVGALWFPAADFPAAERARRLLAQWHAGASALRFAQGELLLYAAPREQHCEALGGWALCRQGRGLCSAPLSPHEAAALPAADVWLVQGGAVIGLDLRDGQPLDPADWLRVDGAALHDTHDCREALPQAVVLLPQEARELREVLGDRVGPPSESQREFLQAMAGRARDGVAPGAPGRRGGGALPRWLLLFVPVGIFALMGWLSTLSGTSDLAALLGWAIVLAIAIALLRSLRGSAGAAGRAVPARPAAPAPAALPERARHGIRPHAWRQWLARLAIVSRLSKAIGRRQAAYIGKMLDMFDSGRLDEALRHAIPLGGAADTSVGQAFGTPGARSDLSLSRGPTASTRIELGDELDRHLRSLYRRAFEQLDRAGRIDEAVFVLAELLHARQEALDYLERHARHAQAAELALAWDQPPAVIVRLHCLAGDWRRAIAVARRDDAFQDAVLQLGAKWPQAAARLREEWARSLAAKGEWLAAVDALWPLENQRALAVDWLLQAEAEGGTLGARALVKRAVLLPDTLSRCAEPLDALARDAGLQHEREGFVDALLALKQHPAPLPQLARRVLPAVLADQGAGRGRLARNVVQRLVTLANDPWLNADLPPGPLPSPTLQALRDRAGMLQGQVPAGGGLPLLDAVVLDDGRYLVALGEAGAAVVDGHGRVVSRFAVPAERLVIAHNRRVALCLAQRDGLWRVSRLDIGLRRATDLGLGAFDVMADAFDGIAWTVARERRISVLDTQRSLHEALWQVTDLPGDARAMSSEGSTEQFALVDGRGHAELWRYVLPQRRLGARGEAIPARTVPGARQLLHGNGGVVELWVQDEAGTPTFGFNLHGRTGSIPLPPWNGVRLDEPASTAGGWLLAPLSDDASTHWQLVSLGTARLHAGVADWPRASLPRGRLQAGHVLLFDQAGRLWHLDTASSAVQALTVRVS